MNLTQSIKTIAPLAVVFAFLVATNFIYAAWTAPGGAPSSGNNAPAPINVGSTDQIKAAALGVDGLAVFGDMIVSNTSVISSTGDMHFAVDSDSNETGKAFYFMKNGFDLASAEATASIHGGGDIWAKNYCDEDGNNCAAAGGSGGGGGPVVFLKDLRNSGGSTVGLSSGNWTTVRLNYLGVNKIGASRSGNQFTLPAGTYFCEFSVPVRVGKSDTIGHMVSKLYNVTDGRTAIRGQSQSGGDWQTLDLHGAGQISPNSSKTYEFQVYSSESGASMRNVGTSNVEVTAMVTCW